MGRWLAVVFAAALSVAVFVGSGTAAPNKTWHVGVGADSADHAVQLLDFYPRTITVNVGDTITFTLTAVADHTVTFMSGAKPPDLAAPQKDGRVEFPSAVAYPNGGHTYGGSAYVNSGIFGPNDENWSVTFTQPGTYTYQCLLHPVQVGTVIVQPAGTPYPRTQNQYDELAAKSRESGLAAGAKLRAATHTTASKGSSGTTYTAPLVGDASQRIALYRFGTDNLTVKVGATVRWVMKDPDEIHTVTFVGTGDIPAFLTPQPTPQGLAGILLQSEDPRAGGRCDAHRQQLLQLRHYVSGQSSGTDRVQPNVHEAGHVHVLVRGAHPRGYARDGHRDALIRLSCALASRRGDPAHLQGIDRSNARCRTCVGPMRTGIRTPADQFVRNEDY